MALNTPVTISELTREIKSLIEDNFTFVYVTGEISNFKRHSSGHFYFTLKDERAQINAIMWSSRNAELAFDPENGMKVNAKGRVTLYESRGAYQIDIFEMVPEGVGDLQKAFEALKRKLSSEGLFDADHKKPIPEFPARVGIVTSPTGAALQDFIRVTEKRYPVLEKLYVFPAAVQGTGAAESIRRAIRMANRKEYLLDIIVLARGGGSIEDLWSFNEEIVAREIYSSRIPVVSAVGHEIDFTISDFTADLRAPTPSAAAEIIFPDRFELLKRTDDMSDNLVKIMSRKINEYDSLLENFSGNYYFKRATDIIRNFSEVIEDNRRRLESVVTMSFRNMEKETDSAEKLLNSFSPELVLKRGFSIIRKGKNIVSRKKGVKKYDKIVIRFYDGESDAVITG